MQDLSAEARARHRPLPRTAPALQALCAVLVCVAGCAPPKSGDASSSPEGGKSGVTDAAVAFAFSSGGEYHMEGFGAWHVRLEGAQIFVQHAVMGSTKDHGVCDLSAPDLETLKGAIVEADIPGHPGPARKPVPDEVTFRFSVTHGGEPATERHVLANDLRDRPELVALVGVIGQAIERCTGEKPVLR